MAYILISGEYISPENWIRRMPIANFGRIPFGTLKVMKGHIFYRSTREKPKFIFYFKNEKGEKFYFDAYETLKANMQRKKLTSERRKKIVKTITMIAADSSLYEQERWFVMAVKSLKI